MPHGGPSEQELIEHVRLCMVEGVGPLIRQRLLERFGSPSAVFSAAPSDLRSVERVGPKLVETLLRAQEIDVEEELLLCRDNGIDVLTELSDRYPTALRLLPDPPGVLFARGEILADDHLAIGIVGTRHATAYGLRQAERLAAGLARSGLTVVSGLARGIDGAAHRGALDAGGRTIAVLASGVLNVYPPEHKELAERIAAQGSVVSEAPPRFAPISGMFPQRNRIISGLTLGTIVIEAGDRSGALITARHAMEQGKEVFALPGSVENRVSKGCHRLIRDGATLVETVDDVLESLGPLVAALPRPDGKEIHHPAELLLNECEQQVLDAIKSEATAIDAIIAESRLPVAQVLATVSVLESRHLVRRLSGQTLIRL